MGSHNGIRALFGVMSALLLLGLLVWTARYCRRRSFERRRRRREVARSKGGVGSGEEWDDEEGDGDEDEDLVVFPGGEHLTVHGILDAPGEVVGKSSYGTLYKASLQVKGENGCGGCGGVDVEAGGGMSLMLLRFVRPACMGRLKEIFPAVQLLGFTRHPNLVPLRALYVGPRGEKLLVHPFLPGGSLSQLLKDRNAESYCWEVMYKVSVGIAKGVDHLHNALPRPVAHGNLKSKNVLLDSENEPHLSDYGMHLLLNPTASQELLEVSASQGYRAPELIKMKDASRESDIYSLGVIFLEILTKKEPTSSNLSSSWELHLPTSVRNLVLERKAMEIFSPQLLSRVKDKNSITEEGLFGYFQLAMACCSPSPSLRPDIKQVLRRLEEIGQQKN